MTTLGVSKEFQSFIAYLNPVNPKAEDHVYKAFSFAALSDNEFTILKTVLPKTKQDKLSLKIENMSSESAADLLKIILENKNILSKQLSLGSKLQHNEEAWSVAFDNLLKSADADLQELVTEAGQRVSTVKNFLSGYIGSMAKVIKEEFSAQEPPKDAPGDRQEEKRLQW